jgi:hypothetical protein
VTRNELLANIRRERGALEALIARVGEGRMTEPVLDGGRSVKDVIAHISAWEKICMALVRNRTPIDPPAPGETRPSTDLINDRIYEGARDQPLDEVVRDAERSYADLLAFVEGLSDGALAAVQGAGEGEGPRVHQLISGNSDGHYREHIGQIERWLSAR